MLRIMHPDKYTVNWFKNYEYIQQGLELPAFMGQADIFIYQNYRPKKYSVYDLEYISENILKKDCTKISFPTLHSIAMQFCYDYYEPLNQPTIGAGFPHGHFKFGIKPVTDLFNRLAGNCKDHSHRKEILEYVVEAAMEDSFIKESDINQHTERSVEFLSEKALSSDIPEIYDFVMDTYKSLRLWHNPYHPNGVLLNEMCKNIFEALEIAYKPSQASIELLDGQLKDWIMPILPSVQKQFGMSIGDYCYSKYHPEIGCSKSYIRKYLTSLYL
jgi:hypothetical protein